jgi:hypothetical protein
MTGDVSHGVVCSTSAVINAMEHVQIDLGDGPCIDSFDRDRPVIEPDLRAIAAPRWVAFASRAIEAGYCAVFAFPLRVGAVRLGAVTLYREQPGALTVEQHADALVLADIAAQTVLMMQAGAPPGRLAVELENGGDFQHVVHQASGMVAVQLGVTVGTALIRLRAHAFAEDRSLVDVASAVVQRTLRFEDRGDEHE